MADLSTLDPSQPPDVQLVAEGAQRIRETRDQTRNSFGNGTGVGGTFAEHYLNGPHQFPLGTTAARPVAGNAGRLYINTDNPHLDYDNGASWNVLGGGSAGPLQKSTSAFIASSGLTTSFVTYLSTGGLTTATGQGILFLATAFLQVGASSAPQVRFLLDGVTVIGNGGVPFNISTTNPITFQGLYFTVAAGVHAVALQALSNPATSSISDITMTIIAL